MRRERHQQGSLKKVRGRELEVDPKIVADQLGHSVDVDLNVYAKTALGPREEALDTFESALHVM